MIHTDKQLIVVKWHGRIESKQDITANWRNFLRVNAQMRNLTKQKTAQGLKPLAVIAKRLFMSMKSEIIMCLNISKRLVQIILSIVFFIVSDSLSSQDNHLSTLYKNNGTLMADSSFSISKKQLQNWLTIEDSILRKVTACLQYPPSSLEAGISYRLLYSFKVNKEGSAVGIKLERCGYDSLPLQSIDSAAFWPIFSSFSGPGFFYPSADSILRRQIVSLMSVIRPLYYSKQPDRKYYLPFYFKTTVLKSNSEPSGSTSVYKGWIKHFKTIKLIEPEPTLTPRRRDEQY